MQKSEKCVHKLKWKGNFITFTQNGQISDEFCTWWVNMHRTLPVRFKKLWIPSKCILTWIPFLSLFWLRIAVLLRAMCKSDMQHNRPVSCGCHKVCRTDRNTGDSVHSARSTLPTGQAFPVCPLQQRQASVLLRHSHVQQEPKSQAR